MNAIENILKKNFALQYGFRICNNTCDPLARARPGPRWTVRSTEPFYLFIFCVPLKKYFHVKPLHVARARNRGRRSREMKTEMLRVLRFGGQHSAVLLSSKFYRIYSLRPCLHILLMFLFCTQTANSSLQTGTNPLGALFPPTLPLPPPAISPSPCTVCYLASDCYLASPHNFNS